MTRSARLSGQANINETQQRAALLCLAAAGATPVCGRAEHALYRDPDRAASAPVHASTVHDDAAGSTVGFGDTASLTLEQAHVGWRARDLLPLLDGDELSVAVGRLDCGIGTGLLVDDGGERGG